jgi:hypothetical protein
MTSHEVVIDGRLEGPPAIAQGGYVSGLVAEHLNGPVEVRLDHPVPVDVPLTVSVEEGWSRLINGDQTLLHARPVEFLDDAIPNVTPTQAEVTAAQRVTPGEHPFPNCFGCGPHRCPRDGLHLLPGRVPGTEVRACTWVPRDAYSNGHGEVLLRYVWAALDCPSYWAVAAPGEVALLGTMSARLSGRLTAGHRYVVVSWPERREGRKLVAGSAICTERGRPVAVAHATWIKVDWNVVARLTGVVIRPGSGL